MNSRLLLAAAAATLLATPALAEDCGPLKSFGTIPLKEFPGRDAEFVPVQVGGLSKFLLLDTGAGITTLTRATAAELKLEASATDIRVYDIAGGSKSQSVSTSLSLGGLHADHMSFILGTPYIDSVAEVSTDVAGLLGTNILDNYDASIDFGAHTLTLLDQNHCDGHVVYWPERPLAIVPFKYSNEGLVVSVTMDGKEFEAIIDSGASNTTLYEQKAYAWYGIDVSKKPDGPDRVHRFGSLSIAGVAVSNLDVDLIQDKMDDAMNDWHTGTLLDRRFNSVDHPPMLLGMNVLRHLHVYIAFKEKKLYITPAAGTPAAATPAAAPAPAQQH